MKILVVVDMQNDFIDGSLGTKEAQEIVNNAVSKIQGWDGGIICTMDTHEEGYLNTLEGKNLPVPHCIYGKDGWKLRKEVADAVIAEEKSGSAQVYSTIYKGTFGSKELPDILDVLNEQEKIEAVTLIGLCTDICVISNALLIKAFFPEIPISVDASCCAGVTPESHRNALAAMKMCQISIENE